MDSESRWRSAKQSSNRRYLREREPTPESAAWLRRAAERRLRRSISWSPTACAPAAARTPSFTVYKGRPKIMPRARGWARRSAWSSWLELGKTYAEMSTAAAQVVAHRTPRIVAAAGNPNARDRREFALMGREKLDAAAH